MAPPTDEPMDDDRSEPMDDDPPPDAPGAGHWVGLQVGCATGALPAIAAIVCAGLTLVRCLAPFAVSPPPPPGAVPVPMTGSAVLSLDGRSVLYSPPAPCRQPQLSAVETATVVSLTFTETDAGLEWCVRGMPASETTRALLPAPLGQRRLVDATTGLAVPLLAERDVLRPREPMAGWTTGVDGDPFGNVTTAMPYFGGPGSAVLVENFTRRQPAPGAGSSSDPFLAERLAVVQVAAGGWHPPPGTAQRPVTVRGRAGVAAAGIVVWSEEGRTVAVIGVVAPPVGDGPPEPPILANQPVGPTAPAGPMPTGELLAIAATLTGGRS